MLVLGRQAGSISTNSSRTKGVSLHGRQSIHLRVGQAELQVDIVGCFAARRWRALFERGLERNEVASDRCVLGVLLVLLGIAHDVGILGVVAFRRLSMVETVRERTVVGEKTY